MNRAQRVDEENGVNCLVVMFIPRAIVTKVSKMAHFCIFCLCQQKSVTVWTKYLRASERSYLALLENVMDCWILSYH